MLCAPDPTARKCRPPRGRWRGIGTGSGPLRTHQCPKSQTQVPLAAEISEDIRAKLVESLKPADPEAWARSYLSWDDRTRRYGSCVRRYGFAAQRVEYFRQILKAKTACFAHYAI